MGQVLFQLLIEAFFKENGLVRQHIDSFNKFIEEDIQEIVNEVGEIPIEASGRGSYKIKFGRVRVREPRIVEVDGSSTEITPIQARLRNVSYVAPLELEMAEEDGVQSQFEWIHIGDIPIMVKSKYCLLWGKSSKELIEVGEDPKDPGGYFIINGSERVVVAFEDLVPNKILVDVKKGGTKPIYQAKVFSTALGFRARIQLVMESKGTLKVIIPGVPTSMPFVVMMRALGLKTDKEIAEMVSLDEEIQAELEPSLEEASDVNTTEDAILFIGKQVAHDQPSEYRIQRARSILDNNFLPHLGRTPDRRIEKARFLAEMASRVIELKLKRRRPDDKDHYANKRLRFAGSLLAELLRKAFRSLCKDIKYQLERMSIKRLGTERIGVAVRPGIISDRMQHALATGNWGRGRVGISQLLDRTNYISVLSHLRRLQSPLSRRQPNFKARDLHPTHWGRLCPVETPEGSNCGLVKNLALMASVSVGTDPEKVKEIIYKLGVVEREKGDADVLLKGTKVFIDGLLVGYTKQPEALVKELRDMRRKGELSSEVNVAYHIVSEIHKRSEVIINCDLGRVRRPLLALEGGKLKLEPKHLEAIKRGEISWTDLVRQGIIELLDADEEENAFIALSLDQVTPDHTHLELAPYTIMGVAGAIIPYAEHNQSPRNSYEAAMAKQALGINTINYFERMDSRFHVLLYPEKPLVTTLAMDIIGYNDRPLGQNCVVALLSYGGYNMEDAVILNRSSVERGLARSTFHRVYEAEARAYLVGYRDRFEVPQPGIRGYYGDRYYRLLEEDGIVSAEADVLGSDVLVGRTSPPRFLEEYREIEAREPIRRDTSLTMRPLESGIVDRILITETAEGAKLIRVRVRSPRIPEIGDKFASRHGQKGVAGLLVPQEDMPFTEDGIVPDIIVNPHAIPSRMTIGQFLESIAGKVAAVSGLPVDATPFTNAEKKIRDALLQLGFQHSGREVLYDGLTGRKYEADIFVGIVYYQKLHHMVADKMHARARGQVQMLTRQPTEGRARGGGLRFGEMERDCLIGYGATRLLRDRLLEGSDETTIYLCKNCGYIAFYDLRSQKYVCRICGEKASISPLIASYAFKLLLQELMSLCISPRLILEEST